MIKSIYVFLLFLKTSKKNHTYILKIYYLFHFIFKNYFQKIMVKQYDEFLKTVFNFKSDD